MPVVTRRSFIAASAIAGTAAALARPAAAAAPKAPMQGPGAYRYKLGDYQLTALYDGTWFVPIDDKFVRNASATQVNDALAAAFLPPSVLPVSFTALLVNTGAKLVLIDTGTAGQVTGHGRRHARQSQACRCRPGKHRHHLDLAFPSRPHRRHQDQRQRQGVSQCRDPGAGAGMGVLDGRRQYEPLRRRGAQIFSAMRGASFPTLPARCAASSPAPKSRPASCWCCFRPHARPYRFAVHSGNQSLLVMSDTAREPWLFVRHPEWQPELRHGRAAGGEDAHRYARPRGRRPHAG